MAYTFAYLEKDGVRLTTDAAGITLNVWKMNSGLTWDTYIVDEIIAVGEHYDISYDEDGVYKISVLEEEEVSAVLYADVNYSTYLTYIQDGLIEKIFVGNDYLSDNMDLSCLSLLGFRFLSQLTYTPFNIITFTTSQTSELQRIYAAIQRVSKYIDKLNSVS